MKFGYLAVAASALLYSGAAQAQFVNGGFEDGNVSGWTTGGGSRSSTLNPALDPANFTSPTNRSAIIGTGYVDPRVGAALGTTVYSGNYAYRVEDTTTGGYASVISQRVDNYQDANIFFAWKAVLEGAHGVSDAATMVITLKDLTTNTTLINRVYNAASGGSGIDPRFTLSSNGYYYTAEWQIEQLAIDASLQGHDFLLSVLAADCQPTGHTGYVYLDGFGAVTPPAGAVPEPATWAMMIMGFGLMGGAMRRQRATVKFDTVAA